MTGGEYQNAKEGKGDEEGGDTADKADFAGEASSMGFHHSSLPGIVICPVKDDLNPVALESVVKAAAGLGRVVVADDGGKSELGRMYDEVAGAAEAGELPTLSLHLSVPPSLCPLHFRRESQTGWKAGNVNAALRAQGEGAAWFAVMDADTVVDAGFFERLSAKTGKMEELSVGEMGSGVLSPAVPVALSPPLPSRVAFVQARLEWNNAQPGALPRWMGPSVGLHFRTSMRARAERGFTMFHGHAAVLSMEAWREAGGLPEIVSEDLGFTLRLRVLGWRGLYADHLVAYEDFPQTVAAWRKRQDKWLRGTLECLRREAWPFLKARHIPLQEKADMLANAAWLYLSPLGLAWFAGMALLQPGVMEAVNQPAALVKTPAWDLTPDFLTWLDGVRLTLRWSGPVCGVMAFLMLAPLVPALMAWREDRRKSIEDGGSAKVWTLGGVVRFWVAGSYLWLSSLVVETLSTAAALVTGRARFENTGAQGRGPGWRVYHANHPLVHVVEVSAGGWFLRQAWGLVNPWLIVPGLALVTVPLAVRLGWERRVVRWLTVLPLLVGLAMAGLTLRELWR